MKYESLRHDHIGPVDQACVGCFEELQEDLELEASRRFWRKVLSVLALVASAAALIGFLVWRIG